MDPYKILDLPKNFTLEQLRTNYKRIALKVHPDKSNLGSDYLFKLVTHSYKTLAKELEKRQSDKQFNQLRNDSQAYIEQNGGGSLPTNGSLNVGNGESFNVNKFNQVFTEYKLEDTTDVGYGNWMAESTAQREEININNNMGKYDVNNFNKQFDSQPVTKGKKVVIYKEPEALFSGKKMGFSELGVSKVSDFSGDNMTGKQLNYTDYKMAHTTTHLVDPRAVKQRTSYSTINELEADRERIKYNMSEKDMRAQAKKLAKEQELEKRRLENQMKRDAMIFKQYEQLNKLLLGK